VWALAASSKAPRSPRVAKTAGIVALAAGDLDHAVPMLETAARLRKGDATVRYNLAQAQLRAGRHDRALEEISAAVAIAPDEPAYVRGLGDILRRTNRREDAIATLAHGLKLRPHSIPAIEAFAAALIEAGRDADAVRIVDERIPEDQRARTLARANLTLKRFEESLPYIDEAIKRDGRNPWNHYLRFNALKGMGDLSGAAGALRDARAAGDDPRFETQDKLLRGLMRTFGEGWVPVIAGPPTTIPPAAPNRILHLLERTLPHRQSGYTVRSLYTVKAQRAAGLDPIVATRLGFPAIDGTTTFKPVDDVEGVPHHRLTLPGNVNYARFPKDEYLERYAGQAAALIERIRPAVLQPASSYFNALVALALKRHFGLPMVYEVRGFQEDSWASRRQDAAGTEYYEGRYRAEALCMREADRVITLADVMKAEIAERGVDPDRITVIPNAVDVERFTPRPKDAALARSLDLGNRVILGYVSSLSNYEGVDTLLRGIRRLVDRGNDVGGLVVGDGPELEFLRMLTNELGIADRVRLTGRVPHDRVLDYYALIDVFVVPRRDLRVCHLVTPLKPFEAMAMGIPLLVSDVAALREVTAPDERGLAFTPEDPEALAVQAEKLVHDEALRRKLGEAARVWVGRERTWARNAERYAALYEELLASRG
jgi:glycosyltransferase involved in cell wall biosynthesis